MHPTKYSTRPAAGAVYRARSVIPTGSPRNACFYIEASVHLPLRIASQRDCLVQIVTLSTQFLQIDLTGISRDVADFRQLQRPRTDPADESLQAVLHAQEYRNKFVHTFLD